MKKKSADPSAKYTCKVRNCGRPAYARGFCQTHHRQMQQTGKTKPIRPYRKRTGGTVRFAGLRLSPDCAGLLDEQSKKHGQSRGAVIAQVLEGWVKGLER